MGEDEDPRVGKIHKLLTGARPKRRPGQPGKAGQISVNGDSNVVGDGNRVTVIRAERIVHRTKVVPVPGKEHITEEQMFRLGEKVREIVRLEELAKRKPDANLYRKVWGALNRRIRVRSSRLIPHGKFDQAERFLGEWIGRLGNTATAKRKDPEGQRKRFLAYINTNIKKLAVEERVRDYMAIHFATRSLRELGIDQLQRVYQYVAGLKRRNLVGAFLAGLVALGCASAWAGDAYPPSMFLGQLEAQFGGKRTKCQDSKGECWEWASKTKWQDAIVIASKGGQFDQVILSAFLQGDWRPENRAQSAAFMREAIGMLAYRCDTAATELAAAVGSLAVKGEKAVTCDRDQIALKRRSEVLMILNVNSE